MRASQVRGRAGKWRCRFEGGDKQGGCVPMRSGSKTKGDVPFRTAATGFAIARQFILQRYPYPYPYLATGLAIASCGVEGRGAHSLPLRDRCSPHVSTPWLRYFTFESPASAAITPKLTDFVVFCFRLCVGMLTQWGWRARGPRCSWWPRSQCIR